MMKKTALVTGANRGIGLAITRQLAELGHSVYLGSRNINAGEEAAKPLYGKGLDVNPIQIDVSVPESIDAAVSRICKEEQRIDILVNNAGVWHKQKTLLDLTDSEIDESIAVHLTGPLHLIRSLVPGMITNGYGRIVNMSSNWGSFAEGLNGPELYGVTKAALNALTVRLAKELPETIKINAMCPGWVCTRMGGEEAALSPEEGADTAIWLALLPDDGPTGGFFRERTPFKW